MFGGKYVHVCTWVLQLILFAYNWFVLHFYIICNKIKMLQVQGLQRESTGSSPHLPTLHEPIPSPLAEKAPHRYVETYWSWLVITLCYIVDCINRCWETLLLSLFSCHDCWKNVNLTHSTNIPYLSKMLQLSGCNVQPTWNFCYCRNGVPNSWPNLAFLRISWVPSKLRQSKILIFVTSENCWWSFLALNTWTL